MRLGLPNESLRIPDLANRTYAEVIEMFLPLSAQGAPLEQSVARLLRISVDNVRAVLEGHPQHVGNDP